MRTERKFSSLKSRALSWTPRSSLRPPRASTRPPRHATHTPELIRRDPADAEKTLELAKELLRTRKVYGQMDDVDNAVGTAPALTAHHIAALAAAHIDHRRMAPADALNCAVALLADPRKSDTAHEFKRICFPSPCTPDLLKEK